jgi:hypothetical protein
MRHRERNREGQGNEIQRKRHRGTETMRHRERNREGQGNEIQRKRHRGTDAMRHREAERNRGNATQKQTEMLRSEEEKERKRKGEKVDLMKWV